MAGNKLRFTHPSNAHNVYCSLMHQDTVTAPAGLGDRVADAVWVKLLQRCHGNCIPNPHTVSCGHQAGPLIHGNTWRETHQQLKQEQLGPFHLDVN